MPTISPERTSRWMSLRSVPNGSSDACESPARRRRTSPSSAARAVLRHGQVLADHHPRHRLRRLLRRHAGAGDLAGAQHRRRVAELLDLVQLVADVEDAAALRRQLAQRLEQLAHGLRRQHRRRLVHDQELRVLQQAADDLDALALADRQRVHEPARIDRQPVALRHFDDPPRQRVEVGRLAAAPARRSRRRSASRTARNAGTPCRCPACARAPDCRA